MRCSPPEQQLARAEKSIPPTTKSSLGIFTGLRPTWGSAPRTHFSPSSWHAPPNAAWIRFPTTSATHGIPGGKAGGVRHHHHPAHHRQQLPPALRRKRPARRRKPLLHGKK